MTPGGWIADLFGYKDIYDSVSALLPRRKAIRFVGGAVTDNPALGTTDVNTGSGGLPRQLFVDPSSVPAGPIFATIQAAINSIAQPQSAAVEINLPPGSAFVENLTFPGGCQISIIGGETHSAITGSVADTGGSGFTSIQFKNCSVTGNFSLTNTGTFSQLILENAPIVGNIAANHYDIHAFSSFSYVQNGTTGDAVNRGSVAGSLDFNNCSLSDVGFAGSATSHAVTGMLSMRGVALSSGTAVSFTSPFVDLLSTSVHSGTTVTLSAGGRADAYSMGQLLSHGVTCTTGTLALLGADVSLPSTAFAANVSATNIIGAGALTAGQYRADVSILIGAAGTTGAAATFNVACTDSLGAFVAPVCSFNIATDTRIQGSYVFRSNGTQPAKFSITGITTPGALAATHKLTLTKID